jgi:hypothetical protein
MVDRLRQPFRLPAPGIKALGPVSGTRGRVRVTVMKLQHQHNPWVSLDLNFGSRINLPYYSFFHQVQLVFHCFPSW